ncbi:MAG: hypothetical protein ABW110_13930, partial [Steroidobacteraceae bacterium]
MVESFCTGRDELPEDARIVLMHLDEFELIRARLSDCDTKIERDFLSAIDDAVYFGMLVDEEGS